MPVAIVHAEGNLVVSGSVDTVIDASTIDLQYCICLEGRPRDAKITYGFRCARLRLNLSVFRRRKTWPKVDQRSSAKTNAHCSELLKETKTNCVQTDLARGMHHTCCNEFLARPLLMDFGGMGLLY